MSTTTPEPVDLYRFVQPIRLPLLRALLAAVPKAREEFESGHPVRAFRLVQEARVEVTRRIPTTKELFLHEVLERLPGDYRYDD